MIHRLEAARTVAGFWPSSEWICKRLAIAKLTELGRLLAGSILLAMATSLLELSVDLNAVVARSAQCPPFRMRVRRGSSTRDPGDAEVASTWFRIIRESGSWALTFRDPPDYPLSSHCS